jgi:hypothetical protein
MFNPFAVGLLEVSTMKRIVIGISLLLIVASDRKLNSWPDAGSQRGIRRRLSKPTTTQKHRPITGAIR